MKYTPETDTMSTIGRLTLFYQHFQMNSNEKVWQKFLTICLNEAIAVKNINFHIDEICNVTNVLPQHISIVIRWFCENAVYYIYISMKLKWFLTNLYSRIFHALAIFAVCAYWIAILGSSIETTPTRGSQLENPWGSRRGAARSIDRIYLHRHIST